MHTGQSFQYDVVNVSNECIYYPFPPPGVALAILEKAEVISPIHDANGVPTTAGTVSAGYQNFLICLEMLAAAIALRYAFPASVYAHAHRDPHRSVTMQSISSSLKVM